MTPFGIVVAAAIAVAALAARQAEHPESSPVTPSGHWNAVWVVAVIVALVAYAAAIVSRRRRPATLRAVFATAVLVQALALAGPLLLSKDVYLYWNHARIITVHHGNPYLDAPARFPADPSFTYTSESWRARPTEYGPLWEIASMIPASAAGASGHRAELIYRIFALLGILAAVGIVARATRNPAAVAFVGWNPLIALHFAGGGHNDAWLAVLLAIAALTAGSAASGGAWAAATLFKGFPGLLVPIELARTRLRPRPAFWLGLAATTAVVVGASFGVFGTAWITRLYRGANTPTGIGGVHWLELLGLRYRYAVLGGALVFACVYLAVLRQAWRTGRARLSLTTSALCITAAQLRPWYALWPVVLAGAEEDVLAAVCAFALTAYLLLADAVSL